MIQQRLCLSILLSLTWLTAATTVQAQSDNSQVLDSVEVVSHRHTSALTGLYEGRMQWDVSRLQQMPQILGTADPLRFAQLLPGVQTNNLTDAGLHIQGSDNQHNVVMIDDVVIYNPTHLFGMFSTFNASHYRAMELEQTPLRSSGHENRLGGSVVMHSYGAQPTDTAHLSGELSIGLITTQGTLHVATSSCSQLRVSARTSFLDPLYSAWLSFDDMQLGYGFQDYNAEWTIALNENNRIWAELYAGRDQLELSEGHHDQNDIRWHNLMGSLHWLHTLSQGRGTLQQTLYYTSYNCALNYQYQQQHLVLPSSISDYGYKTSLHTPHWDLSATMALRRILPQSPSVSGSPSRPQTSENTTQHSREWILGADRLLSITPRLSMRVGLRSTLYQVLGQKLWTSVDPSMVLQHLMADGTALRMHYGWQHQYLGQTGFSNQGFPSEFWYSADNNFDPQYSQYLTFAYYRTLHKGDYAVTAELYGRQLWHQQEYVGNVYDFFYQNNYDLPSKMRSGRGWNFGLNLMLCKQTGRLTGWLSMNVGRALRQFDAMEDETLSLGNHIFPSSSERIFEFNGVINGRITRHWDIGVTGTVASGTPFTAPLCFYMLNGRLLSQYAPYNTNRLPLYQRVDLAMSYEIPHHTKRDYTQSVNISVYNLLGHTNTMYYRLKFRDGEYSYMSLSPLHWPLPSVSYNVRF